MRAQIASLPIDRGQQDRYCIKGYLDKVELDQSPYTIGTSEGRASPNFRHWKCLKLESTPLGGAYGVGTLI